MNPNETLFPIPEVKSPRLKWLEKHHIIVTRTYYPGGVPFDEVDEEIKPWRACKEDMFGDVEDRCAFGDDEQEALHALALKLHIPLWNEEKA